MTEIKKCVGEYDINAEEFRQAVLDILSENKESVQYAAYGYYIAYDGYCIWLSDSGARASDLGEIIGKFYYDDGSFIFMDLDGNEIFI